MTDPVDFDSDEGSPPMLLDPPSPVVPLGHIAWVDTTTGMTSWRFPVRVRDEDVTQDLVARWRVVKKGAETPPFESIALPFNGTPTRDFDILLEAGQLDMGKSHRLDVAVSGEFIDPTLPALFDRSFIPGDVAKGNWWIWEGPGDVAASDALKRDLVDSSNAIEELLNTPSVPEEDVP